MEYVNRPSVGPLERTVCGRHRIRSSCYLKYIRLQVSKELGIAVWNPSDNNVYTEFTSVARRKKKAGKFTFESQYRNPPQYIDGQVPYKKANQET